MLAPAALQGSAHHPRRRVARCRPNPRRRMRPCMARELAGWPKLWTPCPASGPVWTSALVASAGRPQLLLGATTEDIALTMRGNPSMGSDLTKAHQPSVSHQCPVTVATDLHAGGRRSVHDGACNVDRHAAMFSASPGADCSCISIIGPDPREPVWSPTATVSPSYGGAAAPPCAHGHHPSGGTSGTSSGRQRMAHRE